MDPRADQPRDHLIESETQQIELASTLVESLHPSPTPPLRTQPELLMIIVPVYNEHENFPRLIEAIETQIEPPFAVLMVYDFDEDSTVPVARKLAKTRPWLDLVKNNLGRGPANAIRAGFQAAGSGPALVVMGDLSDDLRDVAGMRKLYAQGNRIVCASRYVAGGRQIGGPWLKGTLSRMAGLSLYHLVRFPTHDATNNFRLYDAELVNEMGIDSSHGFEIALELTAKAFARGERIAEVPTTWTDRSAGESRFRLFKWMPRYLRWYASALRGLVRRATTHRTITLTRAPVTSAIRRSAVRCARGTPRLPRPVRRCSSCRSRGPVPASPELRTDHRCR